MHSRPLRHSPTSESDRRSITRDRHADALAAFAARARARATHTTAPRPLRSARHSPCRRPDLVIQHFQSSPAPAHCAQHSTSRRHMPCHLSCGTHLTHVAQSWPQHAHSRHAAAPAMQSSAETLIRPHTHHLLSTQLLCLATPIIMSCHLSLPEQCEPAAEACKERNCQYGGSPPSTNHYVAVGLLASTHY